jgi:uncharacterized SAM-binding protein YcdF (DUF218 family)
MNTKTIQKRILKLVVSFSTITIITFFWLLIGNIHFEIPEKIRMIIKSNLTISNKIPDYEIDILYILGGSVQSMFHHIKTASYIYKTGNIKKIVYYNTNNDNRNKLTERMLQKGGVLKQDIEPLAVKSGILGTMSEACAIADYMRKNSYKSIILVSSPCHTRRVDFSFGKILEPVGISIYVTGSKDKFTVREMILEMIKLTVYQLILNTALKKVLI